MVGSFDGQALLLASSTLGRWLSLFFFSSFFFSSVFRVWCFFFFFVLGGVWDCFFYWTSRSSYRRKYRSMDSFRRIQAKGDNLVE